MADRVRWGIMGAARIAEKVIPAIQAGEFSEVRAIASRDLRKAQFRQAKWRIPKAYGAWDDLLADPEIDAVYIPLPNHLHVPMSVQAAEAGKHVLCEKPIAPSVSECRELFRVRAATGVRIGEAFMVRNHLQWIRAREIVRAGEIGQPQAMLCAFTFCNRNPADIRNIAEFEGGAMMDLGCYAVHLSRMIFEAEPIAVSGYALHDAESGVDYLTSGTLQFPAAHCVFTCSLRSVAYQRVQILGSKAKLEIEIPLTAPAGRACRIFTDTGIDVRSGGASVQEIPECDQYQAQCDNFSKAILFGGEVPVALEDSIRNTAAIEAIRQSIRDQEAVRLKPLPDWASDRLTVAAGLP
jgi:predicted dehydrogenase